MAGIFIHKTSIVETEEIGEGTRIWSFSHVSTEAKIGRDCTIGEHVFIDKGVVIGDRCRIQNGAMIYKGVEIGNDVFIGPGVVTTNDFFPTLPVEDWSHRFKKTVIEDNVSVGANSTIICGVTLKKRTVIGAGSVITKDTVENSVTFGNPAKFRYTRTDNQ